VVSQGGAAAIPLPVLWPVCTAAPLISLRTGAERGVLPGWSPARSHNSPQVPSESAIRWLTSTVRPLDSQ